MIEPEKNHNVSPNCTAAAILEAGKDDVIRHWEAEMRRLKPGTRALPEPLLKDSLPDWLDCVIESLYSGETASRLNSLSFTSRKHGRQRSDVNFNLNEVLGEYVILRQVLFREVEKEQVLSVRDRNVLLDVIQLSMRRAAAEFIKVEEARKRTEILGLDDASVVKRIALSIAIISGAAILQWLLWPVIQPFAFFLFYPAIVLGSLYGSSVVAVILSIILSQYFFIPPYGQLHTVHLGEIVRLVIFAFNGALIGYLTKALRAARKMAESAMGDQQKAIENLELERELREQFVSTLTHDLGNRLSGAKTNAQIILKYPEKTDRIPILAQRVCDSVNRVDKMVQDLLDVNLVRAGKSLPVTIGPDDLAVLTKKICEDMNVQMGARFIYEGPNSLRGSWSSKDIVRLLENLMTNGVKYGAPGSQITVALKDLGPTVELSVHNRGEPIPATELGHLFEPFKRTSAAKSSNKKGWGLGLTLVKGVAEAHRGSVSVTSSLADGTRFSVILPKSPSVGIDS